ncbi:pyridoxal phosphate-dependent aminotransferase [Geomicrobium sp. JCM 19038]|uniref:pyridoxal phosphate-dependent aminotransferase n=1 Tax=Geomicrobium sp. JCM 19038 TaxID=1460635 RepID=UPI00045F2DBA|nr:pyridoxal phosphate-dependent aminotransferase [Geomicrobium sp. JCM 19038]GAK09091.1 glutamine-dependent 2-keto-4-methylthiobutyrate transaminase [Geomicrobium sp. JCM 19038]
MIKFSASKAIERLPSQFFAKQEKAVLERKNLGRDIINFSQGSPDTKTPEHIVESLKEAAEDPNMHRYSPFQGFRFYKEAVCEFYEREYGVTLDPDEEVCVLFGGKGGLVEVSQCLLDEGDVALVPDPGYPDYWSGVALQNALMHPMPLQEEHQFLPNYNDLTKETLEKAKVMFLNYPNNPTGAICDTSFFDETVQLAKENNICVVHDFAYGAFSFTDQKHPSFLQSEGAKDVGIEIYTLSKTYNMAGWRIGFAVGNRSVIKMLNVLQDHLYVSLFGAVQKAAATALTSSQDEVKRLREMYLKRRDVLMEEAKNIGWEGTAPDGSFFAWFPAPKGMSSQQFADKVLLEADVCVAPGNGFGTYGEGYVRLGLVHDEETIRKGMQRIGSLNLF